MPEVLVDMMLATKLYSGVWRQDKMIFLSTNTFRSPDPHWNFMSPTDLKLKSGSGMEFTLPSQQSSALKAGFL